MNPAVRVLGSMALLGALVVHADIAGAQTSSRSSAERRDLLGRALAAQNAGHHADALDLVTRAGEIAMNSSVRRFQAQELEALGRLGEALDRANECLALGADEPQSGPRDQVLADCRGRAAGLQSRVAHVRLHLPATTPEGTEVHVGGVAIPQARWGEILAVTPGALAVEVTAPQHTAFHQDVSPTAGQQVEVDVALPDAPAASGSGTASAAGAGGHPQPPPMHTVRSPVGPVLAVAGVAALIAAGVLRIVANGQYDSLRMACTTGTAPCDSRADADNAHNGINTLDTASEIAAIAGGVFVVGGAVMFFALTHEEMDTRSRASRVRVIPGLGSIALRVTF